MTRAVRGSHIADFLGKPLRGPDVVVMSPGSLRSLSPATLVFASSHTETLANALNSSLQLMVIASEAFAEVLRVPHIIHEAPKLAFVRACAAFFPLPGARGPAVDRISASARISEEAQIGHGVVIEPNVQIGAGTRIEHNAVLGRGVAIGDNCYVKSGAIVGLRGFGFVRDENGCPLDFPHYASVRIGDGVEIGAVSTIVAGSLDDTIIEDGAKINDYVHVAHNVRIGRGTMVAAGAIIGGSSDIGEDCWIGINASLRDGVTIGDRVIVGMGSVVTKRFSSDVTLFGCPATVMTPS